LSLKEKKQSIFWLRHTVVMDKNSNALRIQAKPGKAAGLSGKYLSKKV